MRSSSRRHRNRNHGPVLPRRLVHPGFIDENPTQTEALLDNLRQADLASYVTPRLLLACLVNTVETATYWQEPDVLAATKAMHPL